MFCRYLILSNFSAIALLGYFNLFLPNNFFEDVPGFGVGYGDFVAEVEYGD
jgi:hypothetical protein